MISYKVVTKDAPFEVWASGFHGEAGRIKAQGMVEAGYWHRFMTACDKHKVLIVTPEEST